MIAAAEAAEDDDDAFDVHPDAWPAVHLFCLVSTQWRGGGATGLDYTAVEAACRLAAHEPTPEAFAGLRVMERAVMRQVAAGSARRRNS